jgi:hypothetical protein
MLGLVWYFISNFCILFHLISQRDTVGIIKLTLWYWTQRDTVSIIKLDTLILNTERYCQYHQTWHSDTEHREILSVSSNWHSDTEHREILSVSSNLTLWYWTQRDTVSIIKLDTDTEHREILSVSSNWHSDTEQREILSVSSNLTLWYWTFLDSEISNLWCYRYKQ